MKVFQSSEKSGNFNSSKDVITHASLFSGIGGAELAAQMMGWKNVFHCEINKFGNRILSYWFPESKGYEDITKTDFRGWRGKVAVLTAGFPCFVAGTPVLTRREIIPIEQVLTGDEVLSADGEWHRVTPMRITGTGWKQKKLGRKKDELKRNQMIFINDEAFYDRPGSCGTCPFFMDGSSSMCHPQRGLCTLFGEMHASYINPPRRCQKIFSKAFKYPDGTKLQIVYDEDETNNNQPSTMERHPSS